MKVDSGAGCLVVITKVIRPVVRTCADRFNRQPPKRCYACAMQAFFYVYLVAELRIPGYWSHFLVCAPIGTDYP